MNTRLFGEKNLSIGEVGLGCWQFGGDFGDMEENTALAIMAAAVDNGVTFFDTADVYGTGKSEELIGRFLKQCALPITVATKFGRGGDVYPDKYTEEALRRSVAASARRLGVEMIDLLQLHCIPIEVLRAGDVFTWLRRLKQDGLIKNFGASVETVEEALICLEQEDLLSLQVIFNIFRQKLVTELLPQANARGVGIIVRLPLASGLLAGKFTKDTTFAPTDHRNYNKDGQCFNVGETFAGLPFEKGVELVEMMKEMLPDGMTMAQMALRWILDHDEVSVVIPGASSPEQAKANAAVSDLAPLPDTLHKCLRDFYNQHVRDCIRGPY
ncbi:MAG: aldo/keto reductase [Kiritimatiellales bacterium]|nr:aldo/keto reductase [Kiritimatiellota bacterium]MBL7012162.1 aldo/keto reductase [Kiritimatiellales bacterium]